MSNQMSTEKKMGNHCRICRSTLEKQILLLPKMPLTDDFVDVSSPERKEYVKDILIYQCSHCGIVQNPHDFDHETYYHDYQYSSGHSEFTKKFMAAYAHETFHAFSAANGRPPQSVIEIGSGDGQQLKQFLSLGVEHVKGVEPSSYLASIAKQSGIDTEITLFGTKTLAGAPSKYDICISSYTFDHVRDPIDYLCAAHSLLVEGGILALEIHDLQKIIDRTEYCLFEHEHTIYLTANDVHHLIEQTGYVVLSINAVPAKATRANSLIVLAKKIQSQKVNFKRGQLHNDVSLRLLDARIQATVHKIDAWIKQLPASSNLVGFGAGGRGVMTLAALSESHRFAALFDTNHESERFLAPKTRIPIMGPDSWHRYKNAYCIVFSFGYFDEISQQLTQAGFARDHIVSLLDFYPRQETEDPLA